MIKTQNRGIQEAIREVKLLSLSDRLRARYEAHMKAIRDRKAEDEYVWEDGIEHGRREGWRDGLAVGTGRVNTLNERLAELGRTEDIIRAAKDREFQEKLFEELGM